MKRCRPMAEYSEFVASVRECSGKGMTKEEAVRAAIDDCIERGILVDLLRKERDRVENILIRGLTDEEREELHQMQLKREHEEAREEERAEISRAVSYLEANGRTSEITSAIEDLDFRQQVLTEAGE